MNTEDISDNDNDNDSGSGPTDRRPLGYWLRVVDGLLTHEFAVALEAEGLTRRDWMLLNVLSGDVDAPGLNERLARKGKRLRSLEDRGWAEQRGDGTWVLTDLGRSEKERIGEIVDGIRSRVVDAVGDEAFATTMASLEAIARELGWDESDAGRRGFPHGPGFGGFGRPRPFRPEIRFGWGPNRHHGFEPGRPGHPGRPGTWDEAPHDAYDDGCRGHGPSHHAHAHHGEHHGRPHHGHRGGHGHGGHGHGHGHGGHGRAQDAYERGFDAGFTRGRESGAA